MKISLKWTSELIDIETACLEELIDKLTLGGFEVEEIIEIQTGKQTHITLDISATANRADSLSIHGIASEISALLNQPLKNIKYSTKKINWSTEFLSQASTLPTNSDCQVFFAVIVENLVNLTSPKWLKQKLLHSGINPNDNVQDFQAYIQLETGYPFEFYDLEKIFSKLNSVQECALRLANVETTNKVFVNHFPIGIVGITCDENVQCSNETQKILLEGSIFKAASIRQQSRYVGLRTDRSARYEKSIKDTNLIEACYRLISLLRIKNPDLICKLHTSSRINVTKLATIHLNYLNIKNVLGPLKTLSLNGAEFVSPYQVTSYLTRLKFKSEYNPSLQTWEVSVLDSRSNDITNEIDLIEEIGRLHGFDNFLTQLPKIKWIGVEDKSYITRKKVTHALLSMGLTEFIHYSLVSSKLQQSQLLINPLLSEYSNLRTSLMPNLIQTFTNNIKQGNLILDGFEYGHIFYPNSPSLIDEKEVIAGIFGSSKIKSTWSTSGRLINWFEAKGQLEQFFEKLNLTVSWQPCNSKELSLILHPYRTSQLFLNKNLEFGTFGQINPILARNINVPLETYLFELDFEKVKIFSEKAMLKIFEDYSIYPKVVKDLSFISPNYLPFEELKNFLYFNGTKFLKNVELLDSYAGLATPDGYTSLCVQFTFQSDIGTLQNKHIEKTLQSLKSALKKRFNISIRE